MGESQYFPALLDVLRRTAVRNGAGLLIFPQCRRRLAAPEALTLDSLPDHVLHLPGNSFNDYLAQFPRKRRYNMKREARLAPRIERLPVEGYEETIASLHWRTCQRQGSRRKTPAAFFRVFGQHLGDRYRLLLARQDGISTGVMTYYQADEHIRLFHIGVRERDLSYFSLAFYEPIRIAYEHGIRRISLGIGAGRAKRLRGAEAIPMWCCYVPLNRTAAVVLKLVQLDCRLRRKLKIPPGLPINP